MSPRIERKAENVRRESATQERDAKENYSGHLCVSSFSLSHIRRHKIEQIYKCLFRLSRRRLLTFAS